MTWSTLIGPPEAKSARIVVMEEPSVVEELAQMARASGRSLSAEVRGAIRYWLAAHEPIGDD